MERLTREQAAVIGARTGILCGDFGDLMRYAERKLGRPLTTAGMAFAAEELKEAAREDFLALIPDTPRPPQAPDGPKREA